MALNQMLFFLGLNLTFPIHASLIMMSTPLLITIISIVVLKARIGWDKYMGLLLGIGGAILLMSAGKELTITGSSALGDLLVFFKRSFLCCIPGNDKTPYAKVSSYCGDTLGILFRFPVCITIWLAAVFSYQLVFVSSCRLFVGCFYRYMCHILHLPVEYICIKASATIYSRGLYLFTAHFCCCYLYPIYCGNPYSN